MLVICMYKGWGHVHCHVWTDLELLSLPCGMHGTGSFDENYIHHFVQDAQLAGHRAVVFNYRGLGGAMLRVSGWGGGGACSE